MVTFMSSLFTVELFTLNKTLTPLTPVYEALKRYHITNLYTIIHTYVNTYIHSLIYTYMHTYLQTYIYASMDNVVLL